MITNETRWTNGRGNTKFYFTYEDLADITGLKPSTIRQYVWKKELDPKNIKSVAAFLMPYLSRQVREMREKVEALHETVST